MHSTTTRAARSRWNHLLASSPLFRLHLFGLEVASVRTLPIFGIWLHNASGAVERLRRTHSQRLVCLSPSRHRFPIHHSIHRRHHHRHYRRAPSSILIRHRLSRRRRVYRRHRRRSCRLLPSAFVTAGSWQMGRATCVRSMRSSQPVTRRTWRAAPCSAAWRAKASPCLRPARLVLHLLTTSPHSPSPAA